MNLGLSPRLLCSLIFAKLSTTQCFINLIAPTSETAKNQSLKTQTTPV